MNSTRLSLSNFLRALVFIFCLANAIFQVSKSINAYLSEPTSSTIEKGELRFSFPAMWVCRKPGINMLRLQELGYASLEDLRVGKWMGGGYLDWSANGSMDPATLYSQITRFKGNSLLEGDIIANTEREGFVLAAKTVKPSFNIDFGECVEVYGRPIIVKGDNTLRPNQPVTAILDFKNLDGNFNIIVTDKQRIQTQYEDFHLASYSCEQRRQV